jgi:hypothetical protein
LRLFSSPCLQVTRVVVSGEQRGAALAVPDSIDLGIIPDCLLPRHDTLRVRNGGAVPLTLTQVAITGGFALDTLLDSAIAPGSDGRIVYSLTAAGGEALGEALITAEPCGLQRRVALRAAVAASGLELSGSVDFGIIPRGVPVVRSATLTNIGQIDLRIMSLDIVPQRDGLRVTAPIPPFSLLAGASIPVELELRSNVGGAVTSSITARADSPCALVTSLAMAGSVLGSSVVTASLPDTTGWIDSVIGLPLRIERSAEGPSPTGVMVSVHWDRSMLDLIEVRHTGPGQARLVRDEIVGGVREVTVQYAGQVSTSGIMVELVVRALLGSSESTPLIIDTVRALAEGTGDEFDGIGRNGSFTVLGVCRVGGTRLVRVQGIFTVKTIAPNPATERLAIELVGGGPGTVRLTLVDAVGRPVLPPLFRSLAAGVHSMELPVASMPAGTYVLHVESGPRRESHIVTLLR